MERADDEEEHPHDVLIAPEEGGRRVANLGLDLERGDGGREAELDEGERERREGEDDEEEDEVVVVEEVVGDPGGVAEPDGLGEGQTPPQRRLRLPQRRERQHLRLRKNRSERERRPRWQWGCGSEWPEKADPFSAPPLVAPRSRYRRSNEREREDNCNEWCA